VTSGIQNGAAIGKNTRALFFKEHAQNEFLEILKNSQNQDISRRVAEEISPLGSDGLVQEGCRLAGDLEDLSFQTERLHSCPGM
jgi:hypothetical protein